MCHPPPGGRSPPPTIVGATIYTAWLHGAGRPHLSPEPQQPRATPAAGLPHSTRPAKTDKAAAGSPARGPQPVGG
jgi:hypothetical protein